MTVGVPGLFRAMQNEREPNATSPDTLFGAPWLTVADVANILSVSPRTVRKLIRTPKTANEMMLCLYGLFNGSGTTWIDDARFILLK